MTLATRRRLSQVTTSPASSGIDGSKRETQATRPVRPRWTAVLLDPHGVINEDRGYFTQCDFESRNCHMLATLAVSGIQIAGVYCLPHEPEDGCPCRKPKSGMILRAAREQALDLAYSCLIGDESSDIEAAGRAGIPNTEFLRGRYAADPNAGKLLYV